jgi:hypothetical protein
MMILLTTMKMKFALTKHKQYLLQKAWVQAFLEACFLAQLAEAGAWKRSATFFILRTHENPAL